MYCVCALNQTLCTKSQYIMNQKDVKVFLRLRITLVIDHLLHHLLPIVGTCFFVSTDDDANQHDDDDYYYYSCRVR